MKRIQNCADYMNLAGQFYFKNDNIIREYGLFTRVLNIKFSWWLNSRRWENSFNKDYFPKSCTLKISSKNE